MKRLLLALAVVLTAVAGAHAQPRVPVTISPTTGQQGVLPTATALQVRAATTANSSLNIPQGAAPTSPTNGDFWFTSAGVYARINGATVGPFVDTTGSGVPGGSSGQIQYNNAGAFGGFTAGGDCTFSVPNFTCTKTGGTSFGYFATGTDAANLTGTISVNRFNSGTGATSTTYLSGSGTWTTPAGAGTVTTTGSPASGNLTKFSSSTAITNGDLTGVVTTGGTLVTTATNPFVIGAAQVATVSGAPVSTYPAGTISMRTDVPHAYLSLQPNNLVPTFAGKGAASKSYAVTMSASPTAGNVFWGYCYLNSGLPAANTGWTSYSTQNATSNAPYVRILYKVVTGADTTSQTPCTGTSTDWGAIIYEVSGVDITSPTASVQNLGYTQGSASSGPLAVTSTFTTTTTNTLAIAFSAVTNVGGVHAPGFSLGGSSWVNTTSSSAGGISDNWTATVGGALASSGSGASLTETATVAFAISSDAFGVTNALLVLQPPAAADTGPVFLLHETPNTTASAGQFGVFSADGVVGGQSASQDCTATATLVFTCLKTNNVSFGTFATQNYATPPAIGGTTPAAGAFTTLSATGALTTNVTGGGVLCLHVNNSGVVSGASGDCAAGGSGTVTSVVCGTVTITTTGTCPGGELIGVQRITATGAYTYTPTTGTNSVVIELQGGGAGGSGVAGPSNASNAVVGAGGGAGCWLRVRLTASFSGATGVVGAKGTGGAAGNNNGNGGSNTTFITTAGSPVTYTAAGGTGGGRTSGGVAQVVNVAAGGACTNGDDQTPGGSSLIGVALPGPFFSYSGGGGRSMYSAGAAPAFLAASPGSTAGINADGKGGGGSGAVVNGNTAATQAGGNGSDGEVIIWEYN